jgi:hypothetical protein
MRLQLAGGVHNGETLIKPEAHCRDPPTADGARTVHPVTGGTSFYGLGWNVEIGRTA